MKHIGKIGRNDWKTYTYPIKSQEVNFPELANPQFLFGQYEPYTEYEEAYDEQSGRASWLPKFDEYNQNEMVQPRMEYPVQQLPESVTPGVSGFYDGNLFSRQHRKLYFDEESNVYREEDIIGDGYTKIFSGANDNHFRRVVLPFSKNEHVILREVKRPSVYSLWVKQGGKR